jgi:hypothetical protein
VVNRAARLCTFFSWLICPVLYGSHIDAAYSKVGRTIASWALAHADVLHPLRFRLRKPSVLFALAVMLLIWSSHLGFWLMVTPNYGTESEILSRRTYQFAGIWQFYKYRWLMRISEIFLLENLSINVPYHRLTMTVNGVKYTIHTTRCLGKIRRDFQHWIIQYWLFCSSRNWTYHRIIFTCPIGQVGCRFHLPEDAFHLPQAIGQPLMSNPDKGIDLGYCNHTCFQSKF